MKEEEIKIIDADSKSDLFKKLEELKESNEYKIIGGKIGENTDEFFIRVVKISTVVILSMLITIAII